MSRYRLLPSASAEAVLREHCAHARFVWNLACEQQSWWRPGRVSAPGYLQQCRQLTAARRCGRVDWKPRKSQAVFQCTTCDFACNADVNAARNIAAGHAVTARGGDGVARPVNREPQHGDLLVAQLESAAFGRAEDVKT
jgi:Putative transposase DNA-binding domain/Helix-turn-helix domain